jgi:hypothetical protein
VKKKKKREARDGPDDWGSIALAARRDVCYIPGRRKEKIPKLDLMVVLWPSRKAMRRETKCEKRCRACYEEYAKPEKGKRGRRLAGRLHFVTSDATDEKIVHEVFHATQHAERLLGEFHEERAAYRTDRLFAAIQEFRDRKR